MTGRRTVPGQPRPEASSVQGGVGCADAGRVAPMRCCAVRHPRNFADIRAPRHRSRRVSSVAGAVGADHADSRPTPALAGALVGLAEPVAVLLDGYDLAAVREIDERPHDDLGEAPAVVE